MATLPASTDYTGSSVTQGGKKTFMAAVRSFIATALGTDSSTLSMPGTLAVTGALTASGGLTSVPSSNGAVGVVIGNSHATGYGVKVRGASDNTRYTITINNGADDTTFFKILGDGHWLPGADNTYNLGSASLGMKELFSDNGTINTSDARLKTDVSALNAQELAAAKRLAAEIGMFKFLAAVHKKGADARKHIGMTVQRAIEIMADCGLDPMAYGFICHDVWGDAYMDHPAEPGVVAVVDEEGNVIKPAVPGKPAWREQTQVAGDKYSFRVHELLLFIAAGFEARLAALEAK